MGLPGSPEPILAPADSGSVLQCEIKYMRTPATFYGDCMSHNGFRTALDLSLLSKVARI